MSELVIFDTSIIVDQMRSNRHLDRLQAFSGVIRNYSVVLAELWRGVSSSAGRKTVESLEKQHPILTPTTTSWLESGQILQKMRTDKGFEPHKARDRHFDVLIALTARSHGAKLITWNRVDSALIRE